jgi:tight adherence protein B
MEYLNFNEISIIQMMIIFTLIAFMLYLCKIDRLNNKLKRIENHSLNIKKQSTFSIMNFIYYSYKGIIKIITIFLTNVPFIKKYSLRYEKYTEFKNEKTITAIDYISNKILVSVIITLLIFGYNIMLNIETSDYVIILTLLSGYIIPDIYNQIKLHNRRKQIEKDLLKAIIIMNKSFKAGKSIIQGIEIVASEVDGPISDEFSKIATDISYGLSIEIAFGRFKDRINIEEINYITSVLTIANQTGGNIIKVFTSIEKSLYNKDRLKKEFNALTASSNITIKVLTLLPFVIIFTIHSLNNEYFNPLFNNVMGLFITSLIIIILITYLFLVNRVLRVRV